MSESNRIIYYGEVIDNVDPQGLGRIRCRPKDWQVQSYIQALPTGELENINDKWTIKDPFLVYPLLPIFLYQVPKEKEFVHIIFYDKTHKENNRFYIQGNFSNIDEIYQEPFDSSVNGLALGERNKPQIGKVIPQSNIPLKVNNLGLYPEPGTVGLLGRKNSDILLPENGFIARVNKEFRTPDGVTYNKKHSFNMLQYYPTRQVDSTIEKKEVIFSVYQDVHYLLEYNVYGGLGTVGGLYSGYIEAYKISPYNKISTSAFTENKYVDVSDDSKIGPIYRKDYLGESFETITNGFKQIIKNLNNLNIIGFVGDADIVRITNPSTFPFVFQPNKQLYSKSIQGTDVEITNSKNFIRNVFLNETDIYRGFGVVSEKNNVGILKEPKQVVVETPNFVSTPTTVGLNVSDLMFLLSHESQIPGLQKIDFSNVPQSTGNTFDQNFIWNTIYPNTNSMVRGEKLIDLLELIVSFMINHVHPFHNMPPVSVAKDQTTTQEILTKMFNGYEDILNQKLRIN